MHLKTRTAGCVLVLCLLFMASASALKTSKKTVAAETSLSHPSKTEPRSTSKKETDAASKTDDKVAAPVLLNKKATKGTDDMHKEESKDRSRSTPTKSTEKKMKEQAAQKSVSQKAPVLSQTYATTKVHTEVNKPTFEHDGSDDGSSDASSTKTDDSWMTTDEELTEIREKTYTGTLLGFLFSGIAVFGLIKYIVSGDNKLTDLPPQFGDPDYTKMEEDLQAEAAFAKKFNSQREFCVPPNAN